MRPYLHVPTWNMPIEEVLWCCVHQVNNRFVFIAAQDERPSHSLAAVVLARLFLVKHLSVERENVHFLAMTFPRSKSNMDWLSTARDDTRNIYHCHTGINIATIMSWISTQLVKYRIRPNGYLPFAESQDGTNVTSVCFVTCEKGKLHTNIFLLLSPDISPHGKFIFHRMSFSLKVKRKSVLSLQVIFKHSLLFHI